jgi:phospholipid/cholesterol/gamma-HCH transport system substrate-binding protein
MNNKVNYTFIGFIVLVGFTLMIAFSYWLLKPSADKETQKYNILFDESVLGLNIDATVKYRGIDVGKVTRLRINPKNSEQVEVEITILKSTPIKETTVAKLTSQGITGLSYINLSLGDNGAAKLVAKEGEEYPVIKTEASFFERFEKSLGSVSTKLSKTLSRTEELLDDKNQEQIALFLKSTASFMTQMDKLMSDEAIDDLHSSIKNFNNATKKIDAMMPKIENFVDNSVAWENKIAETFTSIMKSYMGIKAAMDEFKFAVKSGQFNIKDISKDVLPTMNNTLVELQYLMIRVEGVINQYERSPGDILFKKEAIKKGPGEK